MYKVRAVTISLVIASLLLTACGSSSPSTLSNKRLADQAQLATVFILTQVSSDSISVPAALLTSEQAKAIGKAVADKQAAGLVGQDDNSFYTAALDEMANHLITYLAADPNHNNDRGYTDSTAWIGSGFIVSSDGVIVTNAHVAAPNQDEVKAGFAADVAIYAAPKDLDRFAKAFGITPSAALAKKFINADEDWIINYINVGKITTSVQVFNGEPTPDSLKNNKGWPAAVLAAGKPIPGKDVAIIKVEGQKNLPTLSLGDDSALSTGDRLFVMGYPGVATFSEVIKASQPITPSLTSGLVSGRKQMSDGYNVIQTDAATTHGNSGGPVLNDKGQVVGILTFGSISSNGQEVQGFNFAMPSGLIKEFLAQSGQKVDAGQTSSLFAKGEDERAQGHYKLAEQWFTQADLLYPNNPLILAAKRDAATKVAAGNDSAPFYYCWFTTCPKS